jgi:integrase
MRVQVLPPRPEILTPDQLKSLLSGTKDVELLVFIAISAFAGIRHAELERLPWHEIQPGTGIHIGPEMTSVNGRVVLIHPTLDAWLGPFYGTEGQVIPSRRVLARLHNLSKQLKLAIPHRAFRQSYCAYYLALVADVAQVASEAGRTPYLLERFTVRVSAEDAKKFFSLTPENVGLKDWPKLVAEHLK